MDEGLGAALGVQPADVVWENATLFNPFTCDWEHASFAVKNGLIIGIGEYSGRRSIDLKGKKVVPGLIDAHVHIESSLLTPVEFGRLVLRHGTTTVIADPHEIANVAGAKGIHWMLQQRTATPLDIFFTLPSCVPATDLDMAGARLRADDLAEFVAIEGIIGLGEMMNVPGVLSGDEDVWKKLGLCRIIDGHAPLLRGHELNAYIYAGIQSDHESTGRDEAEEKLRRGMILMIREGSTERNLHELIPLVNACTVSRCAFATDDRHADMLAEAGHIDDCIRKAIDAGLEPEYALRMATLSGAERFGLTDRGALAPGRLADFCIINDKEAFEIVHTFKQGQEVRDLETVEAPCIKRRFHCLPLKREDLAIVGKGSARVIGIVEHQITTEDLRFDVDGAHLPDTDADVLKAIVCDRYRRGGCGVGLVHGMKLKDGAIATSVSHDSHNIVAIGVHDADIIRAVREVIRHHGGMAAVLEDGVVNLPLECGGLMSSLPYEAVVERLDMLDRLTCQMEAIEDPFMYLSFIALTVIPHLRLTERGLFDVDAFSDVNLFVH